MIVQNLLNFLSDVIANILGLVPPPPPVMLSAIGAIQDAAIFVEDLAAPFAPIIPFAAFNAQLTIWTNLAVAYVLLIPMRVMFATMFFRPAAV